MMKTNDPAKVLVVGAGPTGLILAHELLRRGIPIRHVDRRTGPSGTSRAFTLHSRTMEMFEHIGVAPRLAEISQLGPGTVFHFQGMPKEYAPRLDFTGLPTRFPFYYKLSQSHFEQALREHLLANYGHAPEYGTALVDATPAESEVEAVLESPTGKEQMTVPWLVGCDGAHSRVREKAGFSLERVQMGSMALMDVEVSGFDYDDVWVNYFLGESLFMLVTKLGRLWRVYLSDTGEMTKDVANMRANFQAASDRLGIGMTIGEPEWASRWDISSGIATDYRRGRVFVCGDASHVHSPAGGMGMNACMQDAFNLGWKLAAVVAGRAEEAVLDTYGAERMPIGEQVTASAKAHHDIILAFGQGVEERMALTQTAGWHDDVCARLSGLAFNYCDVVEQPVGITEVPGPAAGERAPDAQLTWDPQRRVFDLLRHPGFTVLMVSTGPTDEARFRELADQWQVSFGNLVRPILIADYPGPRLFDSDHAFSDERGEMRRAYSIKETDDARVILIRPDLYVARNVAGEDAEEVTSHLHTWLRDQAASRDNAAPRHNAACAIATASA